MHFYADFASPCTLYQNKYLKIILLYYCLSRNWVYLCCINNQKMNINTTEKYDQLELTEFATNAKFKTAKSTLYNYFNIDAEYQVRIYKGDDKRYRRYHVTLHKISEDGITYGDYIGIQLAFSYKDAKIEAAKFYFNQIRS